jgi:hypothetical protein
MEAYACEDSNRLAGSSYCGASESRPLMISSAYKLFAFGLQHARLSSMLVRQEAEVCEHGSQD